MSNYIYNVHYPYEVHVHVRVYIIHVVDVFYEVYFLREFNFTISVLIIIINLKLAKTDTNLNTSPTCRLCITR